MPDKPRIIIIEDESVIASQLSEWLNRTGYQVLATASKGEKAIKLAEKYKPDLILMDIVISGKMDGIEVAQYVKEKYNIPVIFLTAYAEDEYINRAKGVEPLGFLVKPFQKDELSATLEIAFYKLRIQKERKELEYSLRESEGMFRSLAENSPNMVFINKGGEIIYANEKCEQLMGYTKNEFYSSDFNFYKIIAPEYHGVIKENFKKHLDGKEVNPYEYMLINKDGERIEVIISTKLIKHQGGLAILGIVTDITTRKRWEEILKYRLEFERVVSIISSRFLKVSDINETITGSLKDMGEFSGASRAYLFLFQDDSEVINNTHEWCADGVKPQIANLQNLNAKSIPWWMKKLRNGEVIHIKDVSKMPKSAKTEKELLEAQNIRSLIVLPVTIAGEFKGFVGFDNVMDTVEWRDEDINILTVFSDILGSSLERRRTIEKLRESKELFEKIFVCQHDGVFILNSNIPPEIIDCNPAAAEIFGYSREEMLGLQTTFLHVNKASLKEFQEKMFPSIEKKGFFQLLDFKMKRKNKDIFPTEHSVAPILDETKKRIGWVSVVHDISERQRAEQALKDSERKYRQLVENIDEVIYTLNDKGILTYISPAITPVCGYEPNEVIGNPYLDYIHVDDIKRIQENLREALSGQNIGINDYRIIAKNGDIKWARVSSRIQMDENGKIRGVQGILRDITDNKVIEAALIESQEKYKALFEQAADSIVLVDIQTGTIVDFNDKAYQNLGYTLDEFIGIKISDFEVRESTEEVHKHIAKIIKNGSDTFETKHRTKDGKLKDFLVSCRRIKLKEKHFLQCIYIDITKQKKTESELLDNRKKLMSQNILLEEKNVALRQLLSQLDVEKKEIEKRILNNINNIILPIINKMSFKSSDINETYLELLKHNLEKITSSFGTKISEKTMNLTPREIEICNYISNGLTSKEIARILNISYRTVETHRTKIRKKLGLANINTNLTTYLKSFL
ncbi:PAS domain S-box protein [bacterium]|nr:PAS domain S-box protein [bacterium]